MNEIAKLLKDSLTLANGQDYDIGRVLWALAVLVGLGLEIASFILKFPFDLISYGGGVAALMTAGSASLWIKNSTEPK